MEFSPQVEIVVSIENPSIKEMLNDGVLPGMIQNKKRCNGLFVYRRNELKKSCSNQ
jgi:TolB-like protein